MNFEALSAEEEVLEAIRSFLSRSSSGLGSREIGRETPILVDGLIDSIGILELMTFLADELDIQVTDEDFTPENFETVSSLVRLVIAKRSSMEC